MPMSDCPVSRDGRCLKCKRMCAQLISINNPAASEHYCSYCHRSYRMTKAARDAAVAEERRLIASQTEG